MKLTLDTSQKNKACVVLTAAWKPCVIKFVFVPTTRIKDCIRRLWYPYAPSRAKLLRSKLKSLLLCGCLSISQFLMLKVTVYLQRPANAALLVQLQT